jgi:hypothetical protein
VVKLLDPWSRFNLGICFIRIVYGTNELLNIMLVCHQRECRTYCIEYDDTIFLLKFYCDFTQLVDCVKKLHYFSFFGFG